MHRAGLNHGRSLHTLCLLFNISVLLSALVVILPFPLSLLTSPFRDISMN